MMLGPRTLETPVRYRSVVGEVTRLSSPLADPDLYSAIRRDSGR
jgi:hypothetical protein